jgi:hypothetical protein
MEPSQDKEKLSTRNRTAVDIVGVPTFISTDEILLDTWRRFVAERRRRRRREERRREEGREERRREEKRRRKVSEEQIENRRERKEKQAEDRRQDRKQDNDTYVTLSDCCNKIEEKAG